MRAQYNQHMHSVKGSAGWADLPSEDVVPSSAEVGNAMGLVRLVRAGSMQFLASALRRHVLRKLQQIAAPGLRRMLTQQQQNAWMPAWEICKPAQFMVSLFFRPSAAVQRMIL